MKISNTLLLVTFALKFVVSKKSGYSYGNEDFKYNFHCLEDNKGLCKFLKKELNQAVESITDITDMEPKVKFEAFVDDLSKYRIDTSKEALAVVLDNDFVPLYNTNIQSPYPNSEAILKKIKNNKKVDNDFIVVLNNFKSDKKYIKSIQSDFDKSIIVEMFEGLKKLKKIGFPYVKEMILKMNEIDYKYYLGKRKNATAIYETAKENSKECKDQYTLDKLNKIMFWEDTLIGKISSNDNEYKRIVVVGDLHGDYEKAVKVLRHANLIDRKNNWIATDTILIQMGDLTDRGDDGKKNLDLFIKIREQAKKYGGIVYILYGNHEIYNMKGNHFFTSYKDIKNYGGLEKFEKAFSMEGKYGQFIRKEMNLTMIIDDTMYSHAGVLPEYAEMGIDYINNRAHEILTSAPSFDELYKLVIEEGGEHPLYSDPVLDDMKSPMWLRDYAEKPEEKICPLVEKTLEISNTKRLIVGHNVQPYGHINTRCQGKLILVDIGMSRCLGGYAGYLEILNDEQEIWARYFD